MYKDTAWQRFVNLSDAMLTLAVVHYNGRNTEQEDAMPDIQLRFHKDMLVLSAPIDAVLERQGMDVKEEQDFLNLIEHEAVQDAIRMQHLAGAECLVTFTAGITRARLAHLRLEDRDADIAAASLKMVNNLAPQHALALIGPSNLPIDPSSKQSLVTNRDQYSRAVEAFGDKPIDAFFLDGMVSVDDMRCALMGIRRMSDAPVFASVDVDAQGNLLGRSQTLEEAADIMDEYEADVAGFRTSAPLHQAAALTERLCRVTELPVLVQLDVARVDERQREATPDNPYWTADSMLEAAARLRAAGAQFLRATGAATPAYTGALVAASAGLDSIR